MMLEVLNANGDAFNCVEKIGLEDEGFPRAIEHFSGVFEFAEVGEAVVDIFC